MTSFSKAEKAQVISEDVTQNAGAVAANSVLILTSFDDGAINLEKSYRILRTRGVISYNGWLADLTDGPIYIGLAPREFDETAIKERIEANGPIEPRDHELLELVSRRIFHFATFSGNSTRPGQHVDVDKVIRWTFPVGADAGGWNWYLYNASGSNLNAETKAVHINVDHFGVWAE